MSLWLIQTEIFEHKQGLAIAEQETLVSCDRDDDNYTTQIIVG